MSVNSAPSGLTGLMYETADKNSLLAFYTVMLGLTTILIVDGKDFMGMIRL